MKVTLSRQSGVNFIATTDSGHRISVDGSPDAGGTDAGARPMEMVLVGLGGCSAIDVMLILGKSRQPLDHCEIEIDAERADAVPAVFSRIHLTYRFYGAALNEKKIARAVSLSTEKYCSVSRMLQKTAEVTHSYELLEG